MLLTFRAGTRERTEAEPEDQEPADSDRADRGQTEPWAGQEGGKTAPSGTLAVQLIGKRVSVPQGKKCWQHFNSWFMK